MNIIKRLKEVFIPVNQPTDFPRLYFIPDTYEVDAPRRSANDPSYLPPAMPQRSKTAQPIKKQPREPLIKGFIRRRKEAIRLAIRQARDRAWNATKAFGRSVVRWLAWRVFMPLSVIASLWVPSIYPMDLPL